MLYPPDPEHAPEPPIAASEIDTLLGFLERQRATLAWKTGGLDDAGLRVTHAPSTSTLGGMLIHLARFEDDMSTEWLHGEPQLPPWNAIDWETDEDWDWRYASDLSAEEIYALWQESVIRARVRFAEAIAEGGPDRQSNPEAPMLRYILLNMIEEYARHNGQVDLIRESIDGLVGLDPPNPENRVETL